MTLTAPLRSCCSLCLMCMYLMCISAPAAGQDDAPAATDDSQAGVDSAQSIEVKRLSSEHLPVLERRLENAETSNDLDTTITALKRLLADLERQRREWLEDRSQLDGDLEKVRRDIRKVNSDLDDIEDAIVASAIASAGVASPELISIRENLKARKRRLQGLRAELRDALRDADSKIARIENMKETAARALALKQDEKKALERRMARISISAPAQGARLLVDSSEEIRIRADDPPDQVVVLVERAAADVAPGASAPVGNNWQSVYAKTVNWEDLDSTGPGEVALPFKTGTRPDRRSMPIIGLEAFWLDIGEYRVGILRADDQGSNAPDASRGTEEGNSGQSNQGGWMKGDGGGQHIAWQSFSVVGKLGSDAVSDRPGSRGSGSSFKTGTQKVKTGTAMRPIGTSGSAAEETGEADDEGEQNDQN